VIIRGSFLLLLSLSLTTTTPRAIHRRFIDSIITLLKEYTTTLKLHFLLSYKYEQNEKQHALGCY